ncbi:MAG: DUF456 domain-containing protein [Kiritimatiellae bacterium]|jgi:uncharacterized protein YqgC (DUF456 family)|nr:DUF456 domain-containing protein [Kiritimatiellia bacterium]
MGLQVLHIFIYILGFSACLIAVFLSMMTISGTWIVVGVGLLFKLAHVSIEPSWTTLIILVALAGLVEVCEGLAGYFGVVKRGGSKLAGIAASITSFIGGILGTILIPIYIVGSLIGLFVGGFLGAYAVEYSRLKHNNKALNIATGTIVARVFIMVLKVVVTLAMILLLII